MTNILKILLGCFIVAAGVIILQHASLLTGGTAGLSLGLVYLFHMPFSFFFFLINIPFYIFSFVTMGWRFTASTILAITFLSILTSVDALLPAFAIHPLAGALFGGAIIGLGVSYLFINGASLGGAHILALFLQKKFNLNPGKVNFSFDFMVISLSLFTVGLLNGLYSIVSVLVLSWIISYFKGKYAPTAAKKPAKEKKYYMPAGDPSREPVHN